MTVFLRRQIVQQYHFRDDVLGQTTSTGDTKGLGSDVPDLEFRGDLLVYQRTIYRPMWNELVEQTRWGDADTYGHARKPTKEENRNGGRNEPRGEFRNAKLEITDV